MPLELVHSIGSAIGVFSYGLFSTFCLLKRRDGTTGLAISIGALLTLGYIIAQWLLPGSPLVRMLEAGYLFGWTFFLSRILRLELDGEAPRMPDAIRATLAFSAVCLAGCLLSVSWSAGSYELLLASTSDASPSLDYSRPSFVFQLALAVIGIILLEQAIRNSQSLYWWRSRLINIGLGSLFFFALVKAALELLFQQQQPVIDSVHAMTLSVAVPLLLAGSLRNGRNPLRINVSHAFVFQSGTLLGIGLFLVALGLAGYYAQYFGNWALALFVLLATSALTGLAVLLSSERLRRSFRVILAKTFFEYRYDYRERWLAVTRRLSTPSPDLTQGQLCLELLSKVLMSGQGAIYLRPSGNAEGAFTRTDDLSARWPSPLPRDLTNALQTFYDEYNWVLDFNHIPEQAQALAPLKTQPGFEAIGFLIPLYAAERLIGVCLLGKSSRPIELNWEDYDLLKLIANQAAQSLYLTEAERSLRAARQFQAFNQVSAFVAHDIKTVTAQLKLLHRNVQVHGQNPAFLEDLGDTLEHAVQRMEKLQAQLRTEQGQVSRPLDLERLIKELTNGFRNHRPQPSYDNQVGECVLKTDPDSLQTALTHLINNAVDATGSDGTVTVRFTAEEDWLVIAIEDTGSGMSEAFIKNQLFEPFDSTKGLTGMGLGAYQAREYVRHLGGDLEVRSRVGKGTCFTLCLPMEGRDA